MWRAIVFCAIYLQIFASDVLVAEKNSDLPFTNIKGKGGKLSAAQLKKGKLEREVIESSVTTTTEEPTTELSLDFTLPQEYANSTIKKDHHKYYNSTFYTDPEKGKTFWIDIDKMSQEHVITNSLLSNSNRQATTIELSFDFPFYGSFLRNITIATGGFLYMGDYMHNWIAATQYVAPLMANFDTSVSENSTVKYADNGTVFVVQWDKVFLRDREKDGTFTFQVSLFSNGDICFAYKEIPFAIANISDDSHPVKIGISDAYILERSVFFIRRKTIYEYHRVDMVKKAISSDSAIYFTSLPTCLNFKDCTSCMGADANLECHWCDGVDRCSDGIDRQRQSWLMKGCATVDHKICPEKADKHIDFSRPNSLSKSSTPGGPLEEIHEPNEIKISRSESKHEGSEVVAPYIQAHRKTKAEPISIGAIITIVVFIVVLLSIGFWIFYAYRFPQSASGQFLIKYRPSQWTLKPGGREATADSFNM